MPQAPLTRLLERARAEGTAIGAMNVITLEHAEAIVIGAEAADRPVVIQLSENTVAYRGSLGPVGLACLRIAEESSTEVCVHLDHATDPELVRAAVDLGFDSVMFDASTRPHAENVRTTAAIAAWCHDHGIAVEAELGEVGGKDGVHAPGVRTDPGDARRFVEATGVDALAVAVGSSHAMVTRDARLDDDLIARLHAAVPVPLVLHGSSGVPDDGLRSAVRAGVRKVNIATHLNLQMTRAITTVVDEGRADPRIYLGAGRDAMALEVQRILMLLSINSEASIDR
ncbi:fructose-bisphosphate aldolase [Aeromicrobium sp. PE09-221]|uniref:class II fructose-bisphosphate aldolase n=1 Tax=Aeromicrobium sp. PE09-221 TaxID=1898043 RepID=UPI000B3E9512|nr:class II fructose-bisphosphate aldolase [Aeromicrobium sp. PE09-221]OUZ11969.1 fructose-bisphosphate aldolase [Aeromicrobium sp. PE09-221]